MYGTGARSIKGITEVIILVNTKKVRKAYFCSLMLTNKNDFYVPSLCLVFITFRLENRNHSQTFAIISQSFRNHFRNHYINIFI